GGAARVRPDPRVGGPARCVRGRARRRRPAARLPAARALLQGAGPGARAGAAGRLMANGTGSSGRRPSASMAPAGGASPMAGGGGGTNLADVLERVLDKGIVVVGDIRINLLDIELLTIKL